MAQTQYLTGEIKLVKPGGWKRTVIFWEDDEVTRVNTTGKSLFLMFYRGGKILATISEDSGQIEHTPDQGQFNISITDDQLAAYPFQSAEYKMWVDNGDEYPQVIEIGTVRVI